jgi:hypothetical protein
MTKLINPAMKTVAGKRYMGSAAVVLHKGRQSGREYATTTGARLAGDEFLIPLLYRLSRQSPGRTGFSPANEGP